MADEFIVVPLAVRIKNAVFVHHNRILQRAAARQPQSAQRFYILHESEGPRTRHLLHIGFRSEIDFRDLPGRIYGRMIEFNEELKLETVKWVQPRPFFLPAFSLAHIQRLQHADEFFCCGLLGQACRRRRGGGGRRRAGRGGGGGGGGGGGE